MKEIIKQEKLIILNKKSSINVLFYRYFYKKYRITTRRPYFLISNLNIDFIENDIMFNRSVLSFNNKK